MAIDPGTLKSLIERELESLLDARVLAHIRELLAEPEVVFRAWDYGKPGEKYPCWTVLKHAPSETGIAYCEYGFGPRCPWGLVWLEASEKRGSIGMDSGWYTFCSTRISNPSRPRNFRSGVSLKKLPLGLVNQ
jgi:hypothetical protein